MFSTVFLTLFCILFSTAQCKPEKFEYGKDSNNRFGNLIEWATGSDENGKKLENLPQCDGELSMNVDVGQCPGIPIRPKFFHIKPCNFHRNDTGKYYSCPSEYACCLINNNTPCCLPPTMPPTSNPDFAS